MVILERIGEYCLRLAYFDASIRNKHSELVHLDKEQRQGPTKHCMHSLSPPEYRCPNC